MLNRRLAEEKLEKKKQETWKTTIETIQQNHFLSLCLMQIKNNTQLWMWMVMELKPDAVKNNTT